MKTEIYNLIVKLNPVKRRRLLFLLKLTYPDLTDRIMRLKVAELIEDGKCIQSSEKGYSIISTMFELEEAIEYLKKPAFARFKRAKRLHKNFTKDKGLQLSFTDFFDASEI